jgi:hypothetical protein
MTQVEDEGDEQIEFKTDPREFTAAISKFMTHSTVKKEIAAGWKKTCLFRSKDKQAVCDLIDGNGVPEASTSNTSTRSRARLRPQTTSQRVVVDSISPEPSTERTQDSVPCSPLARQQQTPNGDEGLDNFI